MKQPRYIVKNTELTIGERWCNSFLVTYPVSYDYNGGTVIDGKWYKGYKVVGKLKVPKGFTLSSIGCGLQMNGRPPFATVYLKPLTDAKIKKGELKALLASLSSPTPLTHPGGRVGTE